LTKTGIKIFSSFYFIILNIFILIFFKQIKVASIYGTNDDAYMASLLSGNYLGRPDSHLVFIKSFISLPLELLQKIFPTVNIYSLFLLFVVVISNAALLLLLSNIKSRAELYFLYAVHSSGYLIFFSWYFLSPTYTSSAIFAGSVGLVLLFYRVFINTYKRKSELLLPIFLIFMSIGIRVESFLLSLLVLMPTFLIWLILQKKIEFKRTILPAILIIFLTLGTFAVEQFSYRSSEWNKYLELNELRHSIQLRTAEYVLRDNLQGLNWTSADYEIFKRFSLADQEKMNSENLKTARENVRYSTGLKGILNTSPNNEFKFIKNSFLQFKWMIQYLTLLVVLGLFTLTLRRYFIYLFGVSLTVTITLYILAANYHLPERVTFSFLFIIFTNLFFILTCINVFPRKSKLFKLSYTVLASFLLLGFTFLNLPKEVAARSEYHQKLKKVYADQREYFSLNSGFIFMGNGSKIRESWQNPYYQFKNISEENNILLLGWHTLSPSWQEKYAGLGLTKPLIFEEFISNQDLVWIESADSIEVLTSFLTSYSTTEPIISIKSSIGDENYSEFIVAR
jgi:hypothetical protein